MDEKVSEVIAAYDASHPYWRQERREREVKEAKEAEERAHRAREARRQSEHQHQQRQVVSNSKAWCDWVDQRIVQCIKLDREGLYDALGELVATERDARDRKVEAAVDQAQRAVDAKLETLEQRIIRYIEQRTEQYNYGIGVSAGRVESLGKMIETERTDRQKDVKATVEYTRREFETKLQVQEQRIVQRNEERIIRHAEQCFERIRVFSGVIATERADRQKEIEAAVEEIQHAVETKLAALEERLTAVSLVEQQANNQRWAAIDQRIRCVEQEIDGRLGPSALHETRCAIESKLESKHQALEQRLKAAPGKLPVAKIWRPETVAYEGDFVCCERQTWQALKDTAQTPGGSDWICVARAGRDAITTGLALFALLAARSRLAPVAFATRLALPA